MKTDLFTAVVAAIAGVVVAYIVCNIFLPELENVSFKVLSSGVNYNTLTAPESDVFNYRAVNPTVEVYVGECEQYDENGECINISRGDEDDDSDEEPGEGGEEVENGTTD